MSWLGSSAALAVLSFDVDAESPILAEGRRYADHPGPMSHQRYGPLVAVPRILDLLAELGVPGTFFVPGWTADRYPQTVESILAAGHEVAHHGYTHLSPVRMTEADERRDLEAGLAALERHGVRPEGYRTPSWEPSPRTFDLLAEYGFSYDSSLMDDDRPYVLETAKGALVELPAHWGLDDWNQYMYLPDPRSGPGTVHEPSRAARVWREELEGMRRHKCLFMLTMHPFLSGRPGRVEALRGLVEHALACGDVEFASCADAAERACGDGSLPRRSLPVLDLDDATYPKYRLLPQHRQTEDARRTRMKTLAAVDHRVADFEAWKQVYDGVGEMQLAGGVRYHQVLREASDPNRIYVTHLFDTREAAEAFFANPELKAAMEEAGVDPASMKLFFFDVIEDGEL